MFCCLVSLGKSGNLNDKFIFYIVIKLIFGILWYYYNYRIWNFERNYRNYFFIFKFSLNRLLFWIFKMSINDFSI